MSASLIEQIDELNRVAGEKHGLRCELELNDSDMLLTANPTALFQIAGRIIKLATTGVAGSHFTIDRADIAPDAKHSLTISLG